MPGSFPLLKTGKIAQYPLDRAIRFAAEKVRFVNQAEQAYQDVNTSRRSFVLDFSALDDNEVATLKAFFESNQGRKGVFSFTDPYDGTVLATCSFAKDEFPQVQQDEGGNSLRLEVYEHP